MTSRINGLTSIEVEKSQKLHGDNSLKKEKGKGFLKRFFENLSDPIIRILMIALALQVVFTFPDLDYFELFGIISAILLSTMVSTISEYRSEKAFEKLNGDGIDGQISVLRDGEVKKINPSNLVVGDIVYLSSGEKLQEYPADMSHAQARFPLLFYGCKAEKTQFRSFRKNLMFTVYAFAL
jgi:magnesium-transporting ATPase (P-type)